MRPHPITPLLLLVSLTAVAFAALPPVRPVRPERLSPAAADSLRQVYARDRAETEQWLASSPTSYLATVQRVDFAGRSSLTLGSNGDNDVRLTAAGIAPHHLRVTVLGDSFLVQTLEQGSTFGAGTDSLAVSAVLPPSTIRLGRFRVRLSHQRFPALIVFDPLSPRTRDYKGLAYYPVDLAYRFVVPLTANPDADTTIIQSTRGNARRAIRVGWFDVRIAGRPVRLEVHRLLEPGVGEHDMSVFFRDATSGRETYEVGRYVDPEPLPDGRFVVDFNLAYNPACAFSDHYNCPIPSQANHLKLAIRAGERDSHYH